MQEPWNEVLESMALTSTVSKPARVTLLALSRADDHGNSYWERGELRGKFQARNRETGESRDDVHLSDTIRRAIELGLLKQGSTVNWIKIDMSVFEADK